MSAPLKILMLEDSVTDAEIVQRLLKKEKLNFEFRLAMNKDAYLLALDEFQPDLILADYSLPQFNATEALEIIQRRSLYIPFILVTGTISEEFVAKIIKLGADDYILKDRLSRLPAAIEVALKQRQSEKEKLEAQQKLIESENRLRTIFNTEPECIKLLGPEGELLDMNPAGLAIIEAENLQQVKGKSFLGLIKEPYRKAFENLIKNIFKGNSEKLEFGITGLKGTNRWMETHAVPLKDGGGKIISLLSVTRDITEWKKAEEELAEKEFFLRESQRAGNIGSYRTNFVTGTWQSSETLDSIFGININYDRTIAGWLDIVHPDDRQNMDEYFRLEVIGKRKSFNKEYRIQRINDKQTRWICGIGDLKFDDSGNITELIGTIQDITERKNAEEQLRESEQKYRSMVERNLAGIYQTTPQGKILSCNAAFANILGYTTEFLLQQDTGILYFSKADRNEFLTLLQKTGELINRELKLKHKDGHPVFLIESCFLQTNPQTGEQLIEGVVIDISQRKLAEEKVRESEVRYRSLVEHASDGILVADMQGNIMEVNSALCSMFGYSREEVLSKKITYFLEPNDLKLKPVRFDQLQKGHSVLVERRAIHKDGSLFDIELSSKMIGEGKVLSIIRDVSERKKAEEATLKERNLSDSIINSLPGIFYLFDETGKFFRWNKNFETVSGYSAAEMSNLHPLDLFDADVKQLLGNKISEVFTKGMADIEAPFFTKTKEKIPFYFTGWRIIYEGKPCLIGVGIDITERKKAEEAMQVMEQKIVEQKVEEQKKITRAIINAQEKERNHIGQELHDNVNQILAGTKMYLSIAAKKNEKVKELVKYPMELIDSSIKEIRLLCSRQVTPMMDINLKELLQLLLDKLSKNSTIKTNFVYELTNQVIADELKLNIYRILQEQVNNILKHAAPKNVTVSVQANGNAINIIVSDDGKGFNTGAIRKGIGISNMINRIKSFDGDVAIESSPGNGCTVQIKIPC